MMKFASLACRLCPPQLYRTAPILLTFAAAAYVMASIPLQDPSEGRYAVVAQNMLLSGDWITPVTMEDGVAVPFLGKPPLQFWLIATSLYVFGQNELAARLPSLLETAVTAFVIFRFAAVCLTPAIGLVAVFIQLSSLIGFFFAGACMTDPLLAAAVVTTTFAVPISLTLRKRGARRESEYWEYGGFIALSAGLLCKGPIALVLVVGALLPWLIITRQWSSLTHIRWIRGLAVTAAITTPWYLLAELRQPGFLNYFIVHENFLRFLVKKYGDLYGSGHRHFRGMIWFMTMLACMPWLLIALAFLYRSSARASHTLITSPHKIILAVKGLSEPLLVTLGLALFPPLFFTASRQVSIYYTLPSIPALSLLLAVGFFAVWQNSEALFHRIATIVRIVVIAAIFALATFSYLRRPDLDILAWTIIPIMFLVATEWLARREFHDRCQLGPTQSVSVISGYLIATYFAGALYQFTDYVGGGSCRDLIQEVRHLTTTKTAVFYEKIPHSALFYARAERGAPLHFTMSSEIPKEFSTPFVMRSKAYRKVKRELDKSALVRARRTTVLEGGWIVFTNPRAVRK